MNSNRFPQSAVNAKGIEFEVGQIITIKSSKIQRRIVQIVVEADSIEVCAQRVDGGNVTPSTWTRIDSIKPVA